jgi:SH3 domain protein
MHSGPSLEYRIISSVESGSAVETLEYDEQTEFMQVKNSVGKIGWVKSSQLQQQVPAKLLLPKVEKELKTAQDKLNKINGNHDQVLSSKEQDIADKESLITQLQTERNKLTSRVAELEALNVELDIMKETKEARMRMDWLIFGGSILFFGIIFGLIIPFLPRRKKSTW